MAARRMAQESLDSVLQEKSKRYGDSEAVGEALHLKAQGKLRCLACAEELCGLLCFGDKLSCCDPCWTCQEEIIFSCGPLAS